MQTPEIIQYIVILCGVLLAAISFFSIKNRKKAHDEWDLVTPELVFLDKMLDEPSPVEKKIQEAIKKLKDGFFRFVYPEKMPVGQKRLVTVTISKHKDLALPDETYSVKTGDVKIAPSMKLKLEGEEDELEIKALGSEEQAIDPGKDTTWTWQIKALKEGEHFLWLSIVGMLNLDGFGEKPRDLLLEQACVTVTITRKQAAGRFLTKHGVLIGTTLIGSGLIWKVVDYFIKK